MASSKYYWNGVDLDAMIAGSSIHYKDGTTMLFENFPGTNSSNLKTYQTYTTDDEDDSDYELPPYKYNDNYIFKNIKMVSNSYNSDSDTTNIQSNKPAWANACKIYIITAKGAGVPAMTRGAENINDHRDRHNNHNDNDNRNHGNHDNNRNRFLNNDNEDHHVNHNISAVSYNAAAGGDGLIYTTKKALKIVNGDTNYSISATFGSNITLEIKDGNIVKAKVTIRNGISASQNPFTITHHDNRNEVNNNHYTQFTANNDGHNTASLAQQVGMGNEHGSEDAYVHNHRDNNAAHRGDFVDHAAWDTAESLTFPPDTDHYQQYFPYNVHHRNSTFTAGAHGTAGAAAVVDAATTWDDGRTANNTYTEQTTSNTGTTSNIEVYWFKV